VAGTNVFSVVSTTVIVPLTKPFLPQAPILYDRAAPLLLVNNGNVDGSTNSTTEPATVLALRALAVRVLPVKSTELSSVSAPSIGPRPIAHPVGVPLIAGATAPSLYDGSEA